MNIYQENGYLDFRRLMSLNLPFNFIVGGRATGKTYTSLKVVKEDCIKFIYMRRTQTQADLINKPEFSPYKSVNMDNGWNVISKPISKYNSGFYDATDDSEELGEPIGYTAALSTISNIRGFDASDVEIGIYDEFIPEKHERPIKNEASALFNAYESINRNRELKGQKALQLFCLANANDMANPIFLELGLVKIAMNMKERSRKSGKEEVYINRDRGVLLIVMEHSPISQKKADTALYRLTSGSEFADMAINNNFSSNEIGRIKSKPLKEYRPVVSIGEITVYTHKSSRVYYVSTHRAGKCPIYGTGEADRARFRRAYTWLWEEYMDNNIEFEEYLCEILFTKTYN